MTPLPDLPLDELQRQAIDAVQRYERGELLPHEATATLRETAELFVAARGHFFDRDGDPDWGGRTGAYRAWVNETLRGANVDRANLTTLQNAIRYHIGNALRAHLTPEQLAQLGLRASSPRERSVETRAQRSSVLQLVGAGGSITDPDEIATIARLVETTLRRVDPAAVSGMEDGARAELRAALAGLAATLDGLIDAAGASGASSK